MSLCPILFNVNNEKNVCDKIYWVEIHTRCKIKLGKWASGKQRANMEIKLMRDFKLWCLIKINYQSRLIHIYKYTVCGIPNYFSLNLMEHIQK